MRVHYKFGLLLIFLLLISKYCTHAAPANRSSTTVDDFDYNDEYDDDDYYSEVSHKSDDDATKPDSRLPTIPIARQKEVVPKSTNDYYDESRQEIMETPKRSNHVLEPKCPRRCICLKDYKYIRCSNAELTQVPHDIPATATQLDLSQNLLSHLNPSDLANSTKLLEINLSNNQLTDISKETFANNQRLKKINLSSNRLRQISADAFSSVPDLEALDLSNNSIVMPANAPFLNQPRLLELTCRNCSWTKLFDETFENLSSLTALRLDQNDFNKKINTKAFTPLRSLIKLRLPALDQQSVTELCSLLKAIDNISFRHFDVSCYELVLGYSFNESLIQTSESPFQSKKVEHAAAATPSSTGSDGDSGNKKATSTKMTEQHDNSALSNVTLSPTNATAAVIDSVSNISLATAGILATNATPASSANDDKTYQVPVSPEAINIMLICIMIIAVVGLVVGLACRKDVGGVKTKCCRTNKAEPKEDEETQQAEEIPLNKLA